MLRTVSLLRERLDDVHAGDRLLRDDRDLRERLLNVAEDGMRDAAVAEGGERDQRRDRQCDERQLPAVEEKDGADDDDRQDVLGEEDEPVAEEEAHRLQVDRRARHELAGLAAVVEAERQPEEVRVELVAEVVLDAQCLPAGKDPPPVHEATADETEPDDRGDLECDHPHVGVAVELVDDDADQDGDEDARDL